MIRIGVILFALGVLLISPLDEIIILIPLSTMVGLWIIPVVTIIGLLCLIVGAFLIGRHLMIYFRNPLFIGMLFLSVVIIVYIAFVEGWITI